MSNAVYSSVPHIITERHMCKNTRRAYTLIKIFVIQTAYTNEHNNEKVTGRERDSLRKSSLSFT